MGIRAAAVLLGISLAAGGGAFAAVSPGGPPRNEARPSPSPTSGGGVLRFLTDSAFRSLDPARLTTARERNVGRLLYRSLMTYGEDGTSVVPDLARGPGVPSRGGRTWTYALRPDAVYDDGTQIVAADVVRGFRRAEAMRAPTGGATASVVGTSVVLQFAVPFADADSVATFMAFAPVPAQGVQPSGPYTLSSFTPGSSFRLIRSEAYVGDVVRAEPDEIVGELGLDGKAIDRRLFESAGDDAHAVTDKAQLEPTTVAPKKRVARGLDASVLFTALNNRRGPFTDVKVRQAFEVAFPLSAVRSAAGGPAVGDYATDVLPPFLDAHLDADVYGQKKKDFDGDPLRARNMLAEAGYTDGVALTTVVPTTSLPAAQALKEGLASSGFDLTITTVVPARYYATIGTAATAPDLAAYAWSPDWLTPSAYLPPLFTCAALTPTGNHNVAQHCDPAFDAQIRTALATTDPEDRDHRWNLLDLRLVQEAIVVPRFYGTTTALVGKRIGHARSTLAFGGAVDLGNVTLD